MGVWWRLLGWVGSEGSFLECLLLALVTSRLLVVVRVSLAGCSPTLLRGVHGVFVRCLLFYGRQWVYVFVVLV